MLNMKFERYADIMLDSLKKWVPIKNEAFMDYRVGGTKFQQRENYLLQKLIKGQNFSITLVF